MTAATYCPSGFQETDGSLLPIQQFQILYAVIGNTYGGDGRTTFALPDLRSRSPIHYAATALSGGRTAIPQGTARGQESVVQTVDTMAPHTHALSGTGTASTSVTVSIPAFHGKGDNPFPGPEGVLASSPKTTFYQSADATTNLKPFTATGTTDLGSVAVASAGQGQPIPTVPPQLALRFCISVAGPFPPRP